MKIRPMGAGFHADGHEANRRFSQFCELAKKPLNEVRNSANIRNAFLPNRRVDRCIHADVRIFFIWRNSPSGPEILHSRGF